MLEWFKTTMTSKQEQEGDASSTGSSDTQKFKKAEDEPPPPGPSTPLTGKCQLTIHWTRSSSEDRYLRFTTPCDGTNIPDSNKELLDWFAEGKEPTFVFYYNKGVHIIPRKYVRSVQATIL